MRAKTIYSGLLRFYPAAFREEYGGQMLLAFAEQIREARRSGSRFKPALLWLEAAGDVLAIAPKEHFHVIAQDVRYALRGMAANPGFTAVAVLSLALGVGANTAIFGLWNGILHAPLPGIGHPEQLVTLSDPDAGGGMWHGTTDGERSWLTYAEFEQLRDHAGSFSGVMASQSSLGEWQARNSGGDWEEIRGRLVSGGFFDVLGIRPAIGRFFSSTEDNAEAPLAVLSHAFWQSRFGGRSDVLGKTIALRKAELTVIGVAPSGFIGETVGQQPDLWVPLRMQPSVIPNEDRLHDVPPEKIMWLHVFGRLKPGVTLAQAEAESNAIFKAGLESFYGGITSQERRREVLDQRLRLHPGGSGASNGRNELSNSLTALLAAVSVLLLIACANLANLFLARGANRRPEIALRLSLGASRGRLIRQLVTESMLIAVLGGVASLAFAYLVHGVFARMIAQSDADFRMSFSLNVPILAFTAAATTLAAVLFGVLPALQITRADASEGLKQQSRSTTDSAEGVRWGRVLVSLQLALCLPLLVGAGLLGRTLYNLNHVDLGFRAQNLVTAFVDARTAGYEGGRRAQLYRNLAELLRRLPGVSAVSYSHLGLFSGGESALGIEVPGYTPTSSDDRSSPVDEVGSGYFSTVGISILRGREILDSDTLAPKICVINEAFARHYFAGRDPLGMEVIIADRDDGTRIPYRVAGIARDAHTQNLRGVVRPRFFIPAPQASADNNYRFLVRASGNPGIVLARIRQTIQGYDSTLPVFSAAPVEQEMAPRTAQERTTAQVAIAFGCVALLLAAIGLYGVLSYGMARRRNEIAIRIALGARSARVVMMILRETAAVLAAGLVLGAGLAYGASRLIARILFGVAPQDPLVLALGTGLLVTVALCAAYLPARKAARLDPMEALRQQ